LTDQHAESVAPSEVLHEVIQPQGYVGVGGVNCHPFWDSEGRVIVLRCHADGSVTWQLRGGGQVLEPELNGPGAGGSMDE
jgi:hypothetical protein